MVPALKLLNDPPPGDQDSCYVESDLGITSLLRSVVAGSSRAAAYLDDGETFIHTSVVGVAEEPPLVVFEKSADALLNKQVLTTLEITLVTSDHGVPVQFSCRNPALIRYEGAEVFSASLPERILRLQRRGFYRLQGQPLLTLLKCQIVRQDKAETKILHPGIMDLSCGGLSIAVPNTEAKMEAGSRHKCLLELPAIGNIEMAVLVHGSREVVLPDGVEAHRYGVEFLNLDAKSVALIQRFITDEERRAKKPRR
jgi:c-di-GMP-binding flagellar brake protein YcgR